MPARSLASTLAALVFFAALYFVARFFLRWLHPSWWERAWVRRAAHGLAALAVLGQALTWLTPGEPFVRDGLGALRRSLALGGASLFAFACVLSFAAWGALPAAALVRAMVRAPERLRALATRRAASPVGTSEAQVHIPTTRSLSPAADDDPKADEIVGPPTGSVPRRVVVSGLVAEGAAAFFPSVAVGGASVGVLGGRSSPDLVPVELPVERLPNPLDGLRIAQITDLHLGVQIDLVHLERVLLEIERASPHLLVLTGDFCDHMPWLREALSLVEELRTPLGTLAVLGNHEHYRGGRQARAAFDASGVELLVDRHRVLQVGGARLVVAGVDDPARTREPDFFDRAVPAALDGAPSGVPIVGLCHRPRGFEVLSVYGVDVTLSGHTHGAQLGVDRRSLLEGVHPEGRLWGAYEVGGKRLYVSSGAGQWFPLRVGCPAEVPLITLARA
jgi:predicted MPP superfamily phosphohydrolase